MKNIFRILAYARQYPGYAALNVLFNILSVFFSLFSLTMIIPFLNVLLLIKDEEFRRIISAGEPQLKLNASAIGDFITYHLAHLIEDRGKLSALVAICGLVVIAFFFKNLFRYLAMFFLAPLRMGVVKDLRNKIYNKTLVLPLSYYSEERKGDIISRVTSDVQEIEWSVMSSLEMLFREPVLIVVYLTSLVLLSPDLTLFVFILLPISGGIIAIIAKSLKKNASKSKERLGTLFSILDETLGGLRIIKGFNAEKVMNEKFREENKSYTAVMVNTYRKVDLASPLSEFLGVVVMVVILYVGGKLVLTEKGLNAAEFITYIAIFSQMINPAKSFTTAYYNIQKGLASSDRIDKILNAEEKISDPAKPVSLKSFEHQIEYRNVSFAYQRGDQGWALQNINLVIPKGKMIALVGQSGSGKTTLADMLPRFYDPTNGEILVDGVSLKHMKLFDLRSLLGIVSQESILFNDTIFNNISFGTPGATMEQVIHAAKVANAHDFIMQVPGGYEATIGDRGGKLSGGQRQRLSIARAVLKNPPILILDEATSALDTESERLVQDALFRLMENRTSLVIAHRLSTIQNADEIIVMHKGSIIERGSHHNLLASNGTYKKLYDLQTFV